METEDRWYVRFRGHTLGPLTSEQVKASVRGKELGPDDKLASTNNPTWRPLRSQAEFLRYWESLHRPMPVELTPLPSPKILWQKKRVALPKSPEENLANAPTISAKPVPAPQRVPLAKPTLVTKIAPAAPITRAKKAAPKAKKPAARGGAKRAKKAEPKPAKISAASANLAGSSLIPPESRDNLSAIPQKPGVLLTQTSPRETTPTSLPAIATTKPVANDPRLAEETLSLLEVLRDWNRNEQSRTQEIKIPVAPAPLPQLQPRPEFSPSPPEEIAKPKGIELKLNLTISKQFIFIFTAVSALAVAAMVFSFSHAQKMRGPIDSRLPDPSSPTANPSAENDPIPQLKAPTRPKRD